MGFDTILVERSAHGFATIVLNRPDKLNTLSIRLRQEFAQAVAELQADASIRVLIVTGAGRAFSAGLDIDEWETRGTVAAGAYEHDPVAALQTFSGPVIGAVNGLAITGGVELALACDVLIAAATARFADTHVKVGLLPGWGGSVRLARRVGLHRAKELAFTGRFFDAQEALAWGFVNHVVSPDELRPRAEALAQEMAGRAPGALTAYKRLLDAGAAVTFEDALRLERAASIENNSPVSREEIDARIKALRGER